MWESADVVRLYCNVVNYEMARQSIEENDVEIAIQRVKKRYLPKRGQLLESFYSNPHIRTADCCAYLHLYAPLHTSMAFDIMSLALREMREWFHTFLSSCEPLKICSLGGGPGSDVIGVITALQNVFGCFYSSAMLVDIISEWSVMFGSVIDEITSGYYGDIGKCLSWQYFKWSWLTTNLLSQMDQYMDVTIRNADFVIMSKFISAVAPQDPSKMIEDIFKGMRPGAVLLYIDNDGGGHHKAVSNIASECCLVPLLTPLQHQLYSNETLRINKFGSWSCCATKITFQIMVKREFVPVWNYFPMQQTETRRWNLDLQYINFMSCRNYQHKDRRSNALERICRLRRNKNKRRSNRKLKFKNYRSLSAKKSF